MSERVQVAEAGGAFSQLLEPAVTRWVPFLGHTVLAWAHSAAGSWALGAGEPAVPGHLSP